MKYLRTLAIVVTLLAIASFAVARIFAGVTVVPWQEAWRAHRVAVWNHISLIVAVVAVAAWVATLLAGLRRPAA